MIELIVRKFLSKELQVPCYLEHRKDLPESYAPSLQKAAELNEVVKKAVENLITIDEVCGVHHNSDYNFTDTETKKYRYQAVYDINYF